MRSYSCKSIWAHSDWPSQLKMTKMVGAFMKIYLGLVIKTDSLRLFTLSAGSTRVPLKMAIDLNFEVAENIINAL